MSPISQSLPGPNIAVFSNDSRARTELSSDLQSRLGGSVSAASDLEELGETVRGGFLEVVVCMDGDTDGALPLVDGVLSCVAGRVPVILVAPDRCQNAIIQGFRRGVSDAVLMDGDCVAEIAGAIERLKKRSEISITNNNVGNNCLSRLLAPEDLFRRLDDVLAHSKGRVGVIAIQIVEVGYFARKFGRSAVEELTREFAKRLILAIPDSGFFCRRPDSTFVVVLNPVATSAALEMKITQISNELSFLATVSDLEFRIESVTGACDPSIAEEALSAVERAESSLKSAIARQVSYHIAGPNIDGLPLKYSLVRRNNRKEERRGGERKPVYKKAKFFLDHLNASVECIVLDVSRSGARLRVDDSLALPDEFDLLLSYQGERQRVRVRWRRQKEIGVEFVKPRSR